MRTTMLMTSSTSGPIPLFIVVNGIGDLTKVSSSP